VNLYKFDAYLLKKHNADVLIGVDEAGRGPLAGPVMAAACVVSSNGFKLLSKITDSKKLSPKKRIDYYKLIGDCGVRYAVGSVSACEIDKTDILSATFKAMADALKKLGTYSNALVVVDGNHTIAGVKLKQIAVKFADNKSLAVACAGIVAKVERDEFMEKIDKIYRGYGFARHKGYGTRLHYEALEKLGACPEHRRSFIPMWYCVEK
jgi:ribonuclease HII